MSMPSLDALAAAHAASAEYLSTITARRVSPEPAALGLMARLTGPLGTDPVDPVRVIQELHSYGSPATVASTGGRFFGLVVGGTLPAALGARVLASTWDQVVFNDATSPIGCALERCAAEWVVDLLGLPARSHVSFTTGATMANFTCLAAARHHLLARAGHDAVRDGAWSGPRLRVVASAETHVTVIKALTLLGWGTATIERVPADAQGRLIAERLPALDENTIVCLQAGNVNSGSFDPFDAVCQKAGKDGFEAAVRSLGEVNKGLQAIAAKFADYSKKSFEDGTRAFEQLIGAKSVEQAIEIQSQFAKKAFDTYIAEMSKLGEMYVAVARDAYKPVEQALVKKRA